MNYSSSNKDDYVVTVSVDKSCPEGSYELSLLTIASRAEDDDTVLYTDTVTLKFSAFSEELLPYLKPTPKNLYQFNVADLIEVDIGTPVDPQGGKVTSIVDFGKASSFLVFSGTRIRQ